MSALLLLEKDLRHLIQASLSKDYKVADEASSKLSKLSTGNINVVIRILRQGQTCERMKAAQIVVDLDLHNKELIPVLVDLSKGGNEIETYQVGKGGSPPLGRDKFNRRDN